MHRSPVSCSRFAVALTFTSTFTFTFTYTGHAVLDAGPLSLAANGVSALHS